MNELVSSKTSLTPEQAFPFQKEIDSWNMENAVEGLPDYPAKEMGDLISHFDTLQLDKQEPFTWQLSSQIYFDNAETEM